MCHFLSGLSELSLEVTQVVLQPTAVLLVVLVHYSESVDLLDDLLVPELVDGLVQRRPAPVLPLLDSVALFD